ncbi:MAG: hypothetical protein NTY22_00490 [Proteobacteria bacterium]|nr:hypothetical protein [Pseudomonadota bacterium]
MIIKYFLFIFFMLFVLVFSGLVIKPVKVSDVKISDYKDPFSIAREVYAKMLWKDMEHNEDPVSRFSIIKRVVDYTPNFKQAYEELCQNPQRYTLSNIEIKDFIRITKQGAEIFDEDNVIDCYLSTLTGLERYVEALNFLTQQYIQYQNMPRQTFFMDKIKKLQYEKNVLDLTKAVEVYYQKNKMYPGDILVLINEGLIEKIPEDPYGGQYFISRQGQIRSTSQMQDNKQDTKNEN